jgi:hypothetical protein
MQQSLDLSFGGSEFTERDIVCDGVVESDALLLSHPVESCRIPLRMAGGNVRRRVSMRREVNAGVVRFWVVPKLSPALLAQA